MNRSILGHLAWNFGLLSILSIGGANATIPELHRIVVQVLHWMDDATFASLVAIGQTAPGPNVLVFSVIGWHMAGIVGLLVATLAILLPSCLVAATVGRFATRFAASDWFSLIKRALAPIAVGFMLASGYVMGRSTYDGLTSSTIIIATTTMIVFTRRSPLLGIGTGAVVGVLAHRLLAWA